jgi:hypothetical protein
MNRKFILIVAAGTVAGALAGFTAGYFLAPAKSQTPASGERQALYWTDPMVPGFRSDKPGKSPFMDMQLVPVYDDATAQGGMPIVSVRPEITHNLGVRTDKVTRRGLLLAVPREALIRTGTRTALVLALGEGRFQPVEVIAGQESGDWIEIRQGVKDGDVVVTSGQFLIDSEANVRASFQRLAPVEK